MTAHCSRFNDIFSLSEACLLADVVQLAGRRRLGRDYADADITQAVDRGIAFDATALAEDVAQAVTWVHINGELHDAVGSRAEIRPGISVDDATGSTSRRRRRRDWIHVAAAAAAAATRLDPRRHGRGGGAIDSPRPRRRSD